MKRRPHPPGIASLEFSLADQMFMNSQRRRIKNLIFTNPMMRQQVVAMLTGKLSSHMMCCSLKINEENLSNGE